MGTYKYNKNTVKHATIMIIITKYPEQLSNPNFKDFQIHNDGKKEIRIIKKASDALKYAWDIRKRWPEGEQIIKTDVHCAYNYTLYIIQERWPEGEEIIKDYPAWAYEYARSIIKDRWPEGEQIIKTDPKWAYLYAKYVIKGRWPEAEKNIYADSHWARLYNGQIQWGWSY